MTPTAGAVPVLRDYQVTAIERLRDKIRGGLRRLVLVAPTGSGKCLGAGTPVMLADGRVVPVEQVLPWDQLMGPDSQPRRVLSTTSGRGPLYLIEPVKGTPWVCNDAHILTLRNGSTRKIVDISLMDYLSTATRDFRNLHKQFHVAVEFPPQTPLPLDPYFLGVWFGDGTKALNGVAISKPDVEILSVCQEIAGQFGLRVRTDDEDRSPVHHLVGERGGLPGSNPLLTLLRDLVGPSVSIPPAYLTASRADRAAFLAGWIDTDGHCGHSVYDIVQKRKDYAEAIRFLARSLGLQATMRPKEVPGYGTYWRLCISGDLSWLPIRLERKRSAPRRQIKDVTQTGFSVTPIGEGDYYGFELDGDGRFLLGDCTVTHNTVIASSMIRSATERGTHTLVVAHRRELINQTVDKLARFGVPASVMMGHDRREDPTIPTQVATVQTLLRRMSRLPPARLIVLDECHHSLSKSYLDLLAAFPTAIVIGLTATPWRSDRVGLEDIYQDSVLAATPAELIASGALVPYEAFAYDSPDLHTVPLVAGDFHQGKLELACNTQVLVGNVVREYMEHAAGTRAIVFPVSIAHSKALIAEFQAAGMRAAHVDCYMPNAERDTTLARFADGSVTVISSVGILTEGFDVPAAETCILARPTKSLTLAMQMVGRVLRPAPGKRIARIHDHAGDLLRHGLPDDPRDYSLTATPQYVRDLRTCPLCRAVVGKPGDDGRCPKCGEVIAPAAEPRDPRQPAVREPVITVAGRRITADEIRALRAAGARADMSDADAARAVAATTEQRAAEYLRLKRLQEERGFKPGFVKFAYRDTFGQLPAFTAEELDGVTPARFPFVRLPRKEKTA